MYDCNCNQGIIFSHDKTIRPTCSKCRRSLGRDETIKNILLEVYAPKIADLIFRIHKIRLEEGRLENELAKSGVKDFFLRK